MKNINKFSVLTQSNRKRQYKVYNLELFVRTLIV